VEDWQYPAICSDDDAVQQMKKEMTTIGDRLNISETHAFESDVLEYKGFSNVCCIGLQIMLIFLLTMAAH
jgi:hypothetical protein